ETICAAPAPQLESSPLRHEGEQWVMEFYQDGKNIGLVAADPDTLIAKVGLHRSCDGFSDASKHQYLDAMLQQITQAMVSAGAWRIGNNSNFIKANEAHALPS